jgi:drug/metabolite transporter (DMT)-like permease
MGFLWGAETNVGIAAVVATQYATVATLISWLLFKERLSRLQLGGIAAVLTGVIVLAFSGSV